MIFMINLLPPKQNEELKEEENLKLISVLEIIILAFLISLALILFAIKIPFSAALDEQKSYVKQKEEELKNPTMKELEEKIKKYNLTLSKLENFYQEQPELTLILERIFKAFPGGTYLTGLNFNSQESQISLDGFSTNWEILLQFKGNLEKTEGLKEITFPPATWVQSTNINFSVDLKI